MIRVHFLRHGHVRNPGSIFYRRLPGFHLSARGRSEALAAGDWLRAKPLLALATSPLVRAAETARLAARYHADASRTTDHDLTEWDEGELSARVAGRMVHGVHRLVSRLATGAATNGAREREGLLVSHRDPILAALSALSGTDFLVREWMDRAVTAAIFTAEFAPEVPTDPRELRARVSLAYTPREDPR